MGQVKLDLRIAQAIKQGRETERVFIDNVLTAVMLDSVDPQQREGLRLARDIVRGLPLDD